MGLFILWEMVMRLTHVREYRGALFVLLGLLFVCCCFGRREDQCSILCERMSIVSSSAPSSSSWASVVCVVFPVAVDLAVVGDDRGRGSYWPFQSVLHKSRFPWTSHFEPSCATFDVTNAPIRLLVRRLEGCCRRHC